MPSAGAPRDWAGLVMACIILLTGAWIGPVERTQEARVLVTAREMLIGGGERWLLPRMNDQLRLQKPPMAYWLSAAGFATLGVNELGGRLASVFAGLGLVVCVRRFGGLMFGRRAGWLSAATLMSCQLFLRHASTAETDIFAALFGTLAAVCVWRALDSPVRDLRWHATSGAMIGLCALAKGPQAATVLLLLVGVCVWKRSARPARRWVLSGAPVLALLIALPWYAYAIHAVGWDTFRAELSTAVRGGGHRGTVFNYVPDLLRATVPAVGLILLALIATFARLRGNPHLQYCLIWIASVTAPLLLIGQKQMHYLLPALPPLALFTGWWLDRCLGDGPGPREFLRRLSLAHALAAALAAGAVVVVALRHRGVLSTPDVTLLSLLLLLAGVVASLAVRRRVERTIVALLVGAPLLLTVVQNLWSDSLVSGSLKPVAERLRYAGTGPCYAYGDEQSIVLAWEMRAIIPSLPTPQALASAIANDPGILVVEKLNERDPTIPPAGLEPVGESVRVDEHRFVIYRVRK